MPVNLPLQDILHENCQQKPTHFFQQIPSLPKTHDHCANLRCILLTGLSRAEFISVVRIPRTNLSVSVTTPWT